MIAYTSYTQLWVITFLAFIRAFIASMVSYIFIVGVYADIDTSIRSDWISIKRERTLF